MVPVIKKIISWFVTCPKFFRHNFKIVIFTGLYDFIKYKFNFSWVDMWREKNILVVTVVESKIYKIKL